MLRINKKYVFFFVSPANVIIQNIDTDITTNGLDNSYKLEGYTTTMIINGNEILFILEIYFLFLFLKNNNNCLLL